MLLAEFLISQVDGVRLEGIIMDQILHRVVLVELLFLQELVVAEKVDSLIIPAVILELLAQMAIRAQL